MAGLVQVCAFPVVTTAFTGLTLETIEKDNR